jgi:hypothetical protein
VTQTASSVTTVPGTPAEGPLLPAAARVERVRKCFRQAITYFTMYSYNFCWAVRTLRIRGEDDPWQRRTPAMAAGLADHIWSLSEWLTLPAVHRK